MYYMYRSQKISVTNFNLCTGPIPDTGGMGMFFEKKFQKKREFCLLVTPSQMSMLTISKENIFFKTKDTRLCAIVVPKKSYNRPCYHIFFKTAASLFNITFICIVPHLLMLIPPCCIYQNYISGFLHLIYPKRTSFVIH